MDMWSTVVLGITEAIANAFLEEEEKDPGYVQSKEDIHDDRSSLEPIPFQLSYSKSNDNHHDDDNSSDDDR
jgi:hypothetical protein